MIRLHLGAHKTASTHLQHSLRRHRVALANAGLVWLDPDDLRGPPLNAGQLAESGDPALAAALVARAGGAAVVSDENLLGSAHLRGARGDQRLYPDADARLTRLLGATGWRGVALFLGVRDPAAFLASAYTQRLMSGRVSDFATYLDGADPAMLAWSDLAARLLAVPGVTALTVWRQEDYPAVWPDLMARMLPDGLGAGVAPLPQVVHPGMSAAAHAAFMAQVAAGTPPDGLARRLRRDLPKSPTRPGYRPFDATTRAASAAAYAVDMDRVARLPGATLLRAG